MSRGRTGASGSRDCDGGGAARIYQRAEHVVYVRLTDIPVVQLLVKTVGTLEHVAHALNLAHIPRIQLLVKAVGVKEHPAHARNLAHIP